MAPFFFNRYVGLVAGIFMMSVAGNQYMFSAYAQDLRVRINTDLAGVQTIGTMMNIGVWGGVLGGIFLDRFGPRATSVGAGILLSIGYGFIALAAFQIVHVEAVVVGFGAMFAGQGCSWLYSAALKTNLANFASTDRGKVCGGLVAFFGLSGAMYTKFLTAFFPEQRKLGYFLVLLAGSGAVTALVGMLALNVLPGGASFNVQSSEKQGPPIPKELNNRASPIRFSIIQGNSVFIAIFLMASVFISLFVFKTEDGKEEFNFICALVLIGLLSIFFLVPCGAGRLCWMLSSQPDASPLSVEYLSDTDVLIATEESTPLIKKDKEEPNISLLQAVRKLDFWLMFFIFSFTIGTAIVIVNNANEIVISRLPIGHESEYQSPTSVLVTLFSGFNMFGRMVFGLLSDVFIRRKIMQRTTLLVVAAFGMVVVQLYFSMATVPMMYAGMVLLGLMYGGIFCLIPTLTMDIFGLRAFGSIGGCLGLAPAAGSQLFSALMSAKLNAVFLKKHHITLQGQEHCVGILCFEITLFINAFIALVGTLLALTLWYRRRKL